MRADYEKKLREAAYQLGFLPLTRTRSGHLLAVHPEGKRVYLSGTPRNERRGLKNGLAEMERAAGRKLPREGGQRRDHEDVAAARSYRVTQLRAEVAALDKEISDAVLRGARYPEVNAITVRRAVVRRRLEAVSGQVEDVRV